MENSLDFSMSQTEGGDFPALKTPAKKKSPLAVGQAVEARFEGKRSWFPGTIKQANSDGTYDVIRRRTVLRVAATPRRGRRFASAPRRLAPAAGAPETHDRRTRGGGDRQG